MSPTELIYVCVLLSSLGFGQLIKYVQSPVQKQFICTSVGVVIVGGLCGWQAYHSVLSVVAVVAIIRAGGPRNCHLWCFVFCFSYLLVFRLGHLVGLPAPTGFSNVVQLLLTLRLVGISFEIHDAEAARAKAKDESLNHNQQNGKPINDVSVIDDPSIADICQYCFCYIGLFSGPYYTYKTYHDMLHCSNSRSIPTTGPILKKLQTLVPLAAGYVALSFSRYSSAEFFMSEDFYTYGYFQRFSFTVVLVTAYRLRMYAAWLLAECVCISATLGAYPVSTKPKVGLGPSIKPIADNGPSSHHQPVEYNYTTIQNIDWYGCESTTDFRSAMRHWNMTVQWWLKRYVYVRFPYRSWSTFVTFLVSGYWHGIHPGYFLCFLTTPLILIAEDRMRVFRRGDAVWYDRVGWLMKCYTFQYVHMGFQLLGLWPTLRHWASTYFLGHLLTAFFIVVASTYKPQKTTAKKVE